MGKLAQMTFFIAKRAADEADRKAQDLKDSHDALPDDITPALEARYAFYPNVVN